MKIVFLDESTITLNKDMDFSCLEEIGEFISYFNSNASEVIERAAGAECIIVNKVQITETIVRQLFDLKHIAVIATGYNNINLDATLKANIQVSNVSGYAKDCVPQHAFALILNLATRAYQYNCDIRKGEWQKSTSFTLLKYPTFELAGKTIGIIGFGAIGRGTAKIAKGFGMDIMVYDIADIVGDYRKSSLEEIYEKADIVSLHCPLTADNKYMINSDILKKMKKSAILINTARGPLVDQKALADALDRGEIAGAGIDVLDKEPPRENPLLGDVKNLILTPHSAWSTKEARQRLINEVAENIKAYMKGKKRNIVN
jgi:glycerate dehydrogenase